jgi:hypothetical protein
MTAMLIHQWNTSSDVMLVAAVQKRSLISCRMVQQSGVSKTKLRSKFLRKIPWAEWLIHFAKLYKSYRNLGRGVMGLESGSRAASGERFPSTVWLILILSAFRSLHLLIAIAIPWLAKNNSRSVASSFCMTSAPFLIALP